MSQTHDQKHFTLPKVAADRHELMIPQQTMWPSIAHISKLSEPWCSQQIWHYPNQSY